MLKARKRRLADFADFYGGIWHLASEKMHARFLLAKGPLLPKVQCPAVILLGLLQSARPQRPSDAAVSLSSAFFPSSR